MSRIVGVTLLLIILLDTFYCRTDSHAGFPVSKMHILKCRCKVLPSGMLKCRHPLLPTSHVEKQNLIKCICSKANHHKFPKLRAACASRNPGVPISLV
ncbi:hypothetical protein PFLUV_G00163770 [Perca fluviatilis]|uniref:Chemokine interleukin-8-like domain-containing protein n=1 Tax=Perca fluviatilis TaxID=8168 RepID=A0A6A5DYT2_PERFL|nr:hypothetical protein PFLUV_G00163770 [Perca fluviatilis]